LTALRRRVEGCRAAFAADESTGKTPFTLDSCRKPPGCRFPPGRRNPAGGAFLKRAFAKVFNLDLAGAESGVDDLGNVRPGGFSPVRFSDSKKSLAKFPAPPGENRIGEFLKRKQGHMV
jgi:hypothetical protein